MDGLKRSRRSRRRLRYVKLSASARTTTGFAQRTVLSISEGHSGANRTLLGEYARLELRGSFRSTLNRVEVHDSARKHGVAGEDVLHAVDHALVIEDAGEDPDRWLVIGPDRAGNFLEVVVLTTAEGSHLAIHAMPMCARFRRLLEQ